MHIESTDPEQQESRTLRALSTPDPRRMDACTRACEGIPTEELEKGILYELIAACVLLRDDLRVTEILNRLIVARCPSPRVVRRVEQLALEAAARETCSETEPAPAMDSCQTREECSAPAPVEPVAPAAEPPAPASVSPVPRALMANEKFRLGMRVRVSARGQAEMPPTTANSVGVVTGFSRSVREVRIVRDGRTTPERFCVDHWEPDPDYRDVNESIVSGIRTPAGRDGSALPVKRAPALAWRRPPISRESAQNRRISPGGRPAV
jgi:hypothetical protein